MEQVQQFRVPHIITSPIKVIKLDSSIYALKNKKSYSFSTFF